MKRVRKIILAGAMAAFSPSPLFACAACYGANTNSPLAHGMNWGILALLGVVGFMLSSIAAFFFFIIRRGAAMQAEKMAEENLSGAKV
jgi:hypothetical protein